MFLKRLISWFKKLSDDKKLSFVLIVALGFYILGTTIGRLFELHQLKRDGVYYVARIYEISSTKDGSLYRIEYDFNNQRYSMGFKPDFHFKPNRAGAFIYIKLLPENPDVMQYLEEGEVTDSIRMTLPKAGWKSLPEAPRQYLLNGNYIRID